MSYTLYDASIVVAQDAMASLTSILTKASTHEKAAIFAGEKLAEDMLPFAFQVFKATDTASKLSACGTGVEPKELGPDLPDIKAMLARVEEVEEILAKVDKDAFNGRVDAEVTVSISSSKAASMKLKEYVNGFALPTIFFHVTTAYAILRKEGVPLGKQDYLTPFVGKFVSA